MGKFDNIENKLNRVASKASLKSKNEKNTKNILIYNVPAEWVEKLRENGLSFSSYAKMAIMEKMRKDGLV